MTRCLGLSVEESSAGLRCRRLLRSLGSGADAPKFVRYVTGALAYFYFGTLRICSPWVLVLKTEGSIQLAK